MKKLIPFVFLLAGCAALTPKQSVYLMDQTFTRVVNQVKAKCEQRILTKSQCLGAADVAESTQAVLDVARTTDYTDVDAIQGGIRYLQELLEDIK